MLIENGWEAILDGAIRESISKEEEEMIGKQHWETQKTHPPFLQGLRCVG